MNHFLNFLQAQNIKYNTMKLAKNAPANSQRSLNPPLTIVRITERINTTPRLSSRNTLLALFSMQGERALSQYKPDCDVPELSPEAIQVLRYWYVTPARTPSASFTGGHPLDQILREVGHL